VVLRKGSTNDGSSALSLEAFQTVRFFEGIARDGDGQPLVSPELVVQPFFRTRSGGRENVLVRGVEPVALEVHDQVRLVQGRMFRPSSGEAIVGSGVAGRHVGATVGEELHFGRGAWRVVGSSLESEVWVDARELARDARRPLPYSGFRVRVAPGADLEALARRIDEDPRFALEAKPEIDYYAEQAQSANTLYFLVVGLAVLAGIGAAFGATNTLYAAVQARTAEIGTLRALGFSRFSILSSFLIESILLALAGGVFGALLSMLMQFVTFSQINFASWSEVVFRFEPTPGVIIGSLLFAGFMGVIGGFLPALRAASVSPIQAMRN
jgi:putative ABC transport system permease protein